MAKPATTDPVQAVYDACTRIQNAADKAAEEKSYQVVLNAVKSDPRAKQLAAQSIPRFFGLFPGKQEAALNAQIDLCEDDNMQIRVYAIRGLSLMAKTSAKHVPRIADVLQQLLVADDPTESQAVTRALSDVFGLDLNACFNALLTHIRDSSEEKARAQAVAFLQQELKEHEKKIKTEPTIQNTLAEGVQKILSHDNGVAPAEFPTFMGLLRRLPMFSLRGKDQKEAPARAEAAKKLAAIVAKQAGLNEDFNANNEEQIDRFITSLGSAYAFFNAGADSGPFLAYFFAKILPKIEQVPEGKRLPLIQAVASATRGVGVEAAKAYVGPTFLTLKKFMPKPGEGEEKPKINFSYVECFLYMFHQMGPKAADIVRGLTGIFVATGQPSDFRSDALENKEDFAARLRYVAAESNDMKKKAFEGRDKASAALRELAKKADVDEKKKEEDKKDLQGKLAQLRLIGRTTSAVVKLARALLVDKSGDAEMKTEKKGKSQPHKTSITWLSGKSAPVPSWRPTKPKNGAPGQKRKRSAKGNEPAAKRQKTQANGSGGAPRGRGRGGKRGGRGGNRGGGSNKGQGQGGRGRDGRGRGGRGRGRGRGRRSMQY